MKVFEMKFLFFFCFFFEWCSLFFLMNCGFGWTACDVCGDCDVIGDIYDTSLDVCKVISMRCFF